MSTKKSREAKKLAKLEYKKNNPPWRIAKSGETISERFLTWIQNQRKMLLKSFPPGERAFCRIIDKLLSRLPDKWRRRLHYNRQKYFIVAEGIVFFGDFYFSDLHLLVELDGHTHTGKQAKENDEWRTRLITLWKSKVVRLTNDQALSQDFREIELWFINHACDALHGAVAYQLHRDYELMKRSRPDIYQVDEVLTTRKQP